MKKFTLALALMICVSCIPVQAAEGRTAGTIVWNSTKLLLAAGLIYTGTKNVILALSPKARKKMKLEFEKARADARVQAEKDGVDMRAFDASMESMAQAMEVMPVISGVVGAGFTVGGLWLGWSGLKGLFVAPAAQV